MLKKYVFLIVMSCWATSMFAQQTIILNETKQTLSIGQKVEFFEDVSAKMTLEEILKQNNKFQLSSQEVPNFGNTLSAVWFRFKVKNETATIPILGVGCGVAAYVALYQLDANGQILSMDSAGTMLPVALRKLPNNAFLFELDLAEGEEGYFYLKIETDYMQAPLHIGTPKAFMLSNHWKDFWEGIYLGVCLVMFLYNLFVFLSTRETLYVYYVLQIFFTAMMMFQLTGYFYEIPVSWFRFLRPYSPSAPSISAMMATIFVIKFLELRTRAKGFYYFFLVMVAAYVVAIVQIFTFNEVIVSSVINQITGLIGGWMMIIAGAYMLYNGYRPAKYFLLAWGIYVTFVIIYVLQGANVIPTNAFTAASLQLGSAAEMILLSLALADKINIYKRERAEAQKASLEAAKENERLILEQNKILEHKVQERTLALRNTVEELNVTNEELNTTNEELQVTLETVKEQSVVINSRNENIMASINYAKRIQEAMLPALSDMEALLPEHFLFYRPRDIVSGDFYWISQIEQEDKNLTFISVADCTGHGVPGALMSMIGINLLDEIVKVKQILSPNLILEELQISIRKSLKQQATDSRDGMDIMIIVLHQDKSTAKVSKVAYSGAMNPLYYVQNNEFFEIKADKKPIGGFDKNTENHYTLHEIEISQPTILYLCTDGYQDQFGGADNRKFMTKKFKELILRTHHENISKQQSIFNDILLEWMSFIEYKQTDDVTIMGIKF